MNLQLRAYSKSVLSSSGMNAIIALQYRIAKKRVCCPAALIYEILNR